MRSKSLTLFPLFLVLVIETMGMGIILPVLGPLFVDTAGTIVDPAMTQAWRQFLYGATLGIFSIAMLFGAPILGDLSDRVGRKKTIVLSLLGSALGLFISAIGIDINSFLLLFFGRFFAGFFAGSQPIAQAAIADISTPEEKAVNMGLIILANCVGFIFGPVFGGYFADAGTFSWSTFSTPFYAAAILTVINAVLVLITFKETFKSTATQAINILRGLTIFAEAFRHKEIKMLALVTFFCELGWSMFFLYLTLFLMRVHHFSGVDIGHYMSSYGIVWAFTLMLLVRLIVKYFRMESVVFQSLLIYGLFIYALLFHNNTVLWLTVIPIGIGSALAYSGLITIMSNIVGADKQGWVMGISSSVLAAAWGLGGVLSGLLGSHGVNIPFIMAGTITLISAFVMRVCCFK